VRQAKAVQYVTKDSACIVRRSAAARVIESYLPSRHAMTFTIRVGVAQQNMRGVKKCLCHGCIVRSPPCRMPGQLFAAAPPPITRSLAYARRMPLRVCIRPCRRSELEAFSKRWWRI